MIGWLAGDWQPPETFNEWRARQVRRERWLKRLGVLAGLVLACVLSWAAIGCVLGSL